MMMTVDLHVEARGNPEMQKLHGVGKFFNEWRADPLPPSSQISQKKEISYWKRKSHKKHKKVLLNLRKNFFLGNYGWLTCQLKIITGIYISAGYQIELG